MSALGEGYLGTSYLGGRLRFRNRHVQQTIADLVQEGLTALGWAGPAAPFGTIPVTFVEVEPQEAGLKIAPNTVATTLGDEGEYLIHEMGGALSYVEYPVFVDIYGASTSIALSIASDVRELLHGRIAKVRDYSSASAGVEIDEQIEFQAVTVERPPAVNTAVDFKRYWRIVRAVAVVYFAE